jgi:hypothetical protein
LDSVVKTVDSHTEIVVIDNASTDNSISLVKQEFPGVRIIENNRNMGFSQAYNSAVTETRADFVVLLNNDVVTRDSWLTALLAPLLEDPSVGVTTPKIVFLGTRRINSIGGYIKLWTGASELGFGMREDSSLGNLRNPFYASGAAMAIRRDLFEHLGGFDKEMLAYCEDLDLSWRVRLLGYAVRCTPDSRILHAYSRSWGAFNPNRVRLVTQNHLRAMIKCLSLPYVVASVPAYVVFSVVKGLFLSATQRDIRYTKSVGLGLAGVIRGWKGLLLQRGITQNSRRVPDEIALKSDGFGLFNTPAEFLAQMKTMKEVSQDQSPGGKSEAPAKLCLN